MEQNKEKKSALTMEEYRSKDPLFTFENDYQPLHYVDATPDDGYPLRILEAHLANSKSRIVVGSEASPLFQAMNEAQAKREVILQEAINKLRS